MFTSGYVSADMVMKLLPDNDVNWDMQTDTIYITQIAKDYYIVESALCEYPIGVFDVSDVSTLLMWIEQYPPSTDDELEHTQLYYQGLVQEKIWE